jgi:DNA polymerase-3 subunit delta
LSIIKSDQFETFFAKPPRGVALFLLHGGDSELANERARRLVAKLADDPLQIVRLDSDTLSKDPGRLADEANAISMFGGRRVVWVEAGGRDLSPLLAPLVDRPPQDTAIVVEADALKKGTPLRVLFESRPTTAAIECYAPEARSLSAMIEAEARAAGVELSREALATLAALLAEEPGAARSEIAKLMLYAKGAPRIELADIEALFPEAGVSNVDATIDAALGGNLEALEARAVHTLGDEGEAAQAAVRLAQRVALLLEIRHGGEPAIMFRLPFAVKDAIQAQARSGSAEELARRLPGLLRLMLQVRRAAPLAGPATFRAMVALAYAAQRGARARS